MPVLEPIDVPPELLAARDAVEADLLALPGVTGVGVGLEEVNGQPTGRLAIRVMVAHKGDVPGDELVPAEMLGFPTDVFEGRPELEQLPDTHRYDPLLGGISGGPCKVTASIAPDGALGVAAHNGTLGGFVRDTATGRLMLISNAHVLDPDQQVPDMGAAVQPELHDGQCPTDAIGPIARSSRRLPNPPFTVDAAVVELYGARTHAAPGIREIGPVRGATLPMPGQPVRKRGRTTGLTFGYIADVAMTATNDSGEQLRQQITVRVDHDHSSDWSKKGDSGSLVLTADDRVVGLHWGGFAGVLGYANPIHQVEQVLGVTVASLPAIDSMTPSATWVGPLASSVTLTGRGFQGGDLVPTFTQPQVLFGGKLATISSATDDQIVVTPPLELFPTTVDVIVRYGWEESAPVPFTYETVPVLASVSPPQGTSAGGDTVNIFGAGLAGLHRVTFAGNDAEITSVIDNHVQVTSPPATGPGPADVAILKDAGRSAAWFGAQFTYL